MLVGANEGGWGQRERGKSPIDIRAKFLEAKQEVGRRVGVKKGGKGKNSRYKTIKYRTTQHVD